MELCFFALLKNKQIKTNTSANNAQHYRRPELTLLLHLILLKAHTLLKNEYRRC